MPKRHRSRSVDRQGETNSNCIIQGAFKRAKGHFEYKRMFLRNTVVDLRDQARVYGQKRWYSMKKPSLVAVVIVNKSSSIISGFFRRIIQDSRKRVIERSIESDEFCPICLTPVSELINPYVHDGIVFSREDLVFFFMNSYNFTNPMTRRDFTDADIKRFGSPTLCDVFYDREYLRKDVIHGVQQFSFLESQFEVLVKNMVSLYHYQDEREYCETALSLENVWEDMMSIDRNRTVCVIKSARTILDDLSGRRKKWARALLDNINERTQG